MDVEAALARIGHRQIGLITRRQALAAGLTSAGIQTRLARGDWRRIRRGVYAIAGVRPSLAQAHLAVCLAVGDGCCVSHRSAAALWDLRVPRPDRIEVVTPTEVRAALAGVVQHRSTELFGSDLTRHQLVPLTSVARTLIDCIPNLPGPRLVAAVDDAERRHVLRTDDLLSCAERLDHRGRRLLAPLRAVLADREEGHRAGGSEWELTVLDILLAAGVPPPVQQYEVVVGGRRRILDYAYPEEMVALEFDGFDPHATIRSVFDDGAIRGNDLEVVGWLILHITSKTPASHIVERTRQALAHRRRMASVLGSLGSLGGLGGVGGDHGGVGQPFPVTVPG